jgi:hypothetical protein
MKSCIRRRRRVRPERGDLRSLKMRYLTSRHLLSSTTPPRRQARTAARLRATEELYEKLYPETISVRSRGGPGRGKKNQSQIEISFVDDASRKIFDGRYRTPGRLRNPAPTMPACGLISPARTRASAGSLDRRRRLAVPPVPPSPVRARQRTSRRAQPRGHECSANVHNSSVIVASSGLRFWLSLVH